MRAYVLLIAGWHVHPMSPRHYLRSGMARPFCVWRCAVLALDGVADSPYHDGRWTGQRFETLWLVKMTRATSE